MTNFIICDTEYTTGINARKTNWGLAGAHREIIQISAVTFNFNTPWQEAQTFDAFIKPILNPILSERTTNVTGITQQDVDNAESTEDVLWNFQQFSKNQPVYSNGNDINPVAETCGLQSIKNPLTVTNWASLREPLYAALHQVVGDFDDEEYPSGELYKLLGINMNGRAHNALHDCHSIAATLQELAKRGHEINLPNVPQRATW